MDLAKKKQMVRAVSTKFKTEELTFFHGVGIEFGLKLRSQARSLPFLLAPADNLMEKANCYKYESLFRCRFVSVMQRSEHVLASSCFSN